MKMIRGVVIQWIRARALNVEVPGSIHVGNDPLSLGKKVNSYFFTLPKGKSDWNLKPATLGGKPAKDWRPVTGVIYHSFAYRHANRA